jgi:phage baseplate assembly protein gpV
MMQHLLNAMRAQAQMADNGRAQTRFGLVSSYDPANYSAKVILQPDGLETGWLPVLSPWIGNGWGLFAPPSIGDMVEVRFIQDDSEAGFISLRGFNDTDRPLNVSSGEFWLQHKSGSFLKFHNDGTVELVSSGTLTSTAPQWNHNGNMQVNGTIKATGDITDTSSTNTRSVAGMRTIFNGHLHSGVQTGGGNTAVPTGGM